MKNYLKVVFNINIFEPFIYEKPEFIKKTIKFYRVLAPFNNRLKMGIVIDDFLEKEDNFKFKIETILDVIDENQLFNEREFKFLQWLSEYYIVPLGQIIFNAIPPFSMDNYKITINEENILNCSSIEKEFIKKIKKEKSLKKLQKDIPFFFAKLTDLNEKNIIHLEKHIPTTRKLKFVKFKNSSTLLPYKIAKQKIGRKFNTLMKQGEVIIIEKSKEFLPETLDASFEYKRPDKLTAEQENTWNIIEKHIQKNKFSCHLIFGITGSGKTEVYLKAIEATLKKGKSVLYLVPEISLTSNIAFIILNNFPDYKIGIYHSKISNSLRQKLWEDIYKGDIQILIGARSAIFAPMKNLGLIVVDEEHEQSYKQEDKPRYHCRDSAVMKGKLHNATVLLGSGTPSVNSYYNAVTGKYHLHILSKRVNQLPLPEFEIIDLKEFKNDFIISPPLKNEIKKRLEKKEQTILLINKKGYASFLLCQDCGYVFKCKNCDTSLTYYKSLKKLICSICDNRYSIPVECPVCKGTLLKYLGKGTEKIVEKAISELENIKVERFDAQATLKKGKSTEILKKFNKGDIDVIVGTQMIAKGYDFKNVTLVGIISIDNMLNFPDYNSTEKTFQLIMQCAGRAGRKDKQGKVILQTFSPDNYLFKFCKNYQLKDYYEYELNQRKAANYPPFFALVHIILESTNEARVVEFSEKVSSYLCNIKPSTVILLGPVPSQIKKIRNRYRYSILLKGKTRKTLNKICFNLIQKYGRVSGVDIKLDIDPVSLI